MGELGSNLDGRVDDVQHSDALVFLEGLVRAVDGELPVQPK